MITVATLVVAGLLAGGPTCQAKPAVVECEIGPFELPRMRVRHCLDSVACSPHPVDSLPGDATIRDLWQADRGECRAYALMPKDWDHWTPARGLFGVADVAHNNARAFDQAYAEHLLVAPVLAVLANDAGIWGCGDTRQAHYDAELLKKFGVCVNHRGATAASPHWPQLMNTPLLMRCDGERTNDWILIGPGNTPMPPEDWNASGALESQVLERLRKIPGHELVCVTPELAEDRRAARRVDLAAAE